MLVFSLREIGNKMFTLRKKLGLTQSELAEIAGLSDRTYAEIERGSVNMRIETALKICETLHVTPNEIFTQEETQSIVKTESICERLKLCNSTEKETALKLLDIYLNSLNK